MKKNTVLCITLSLVFTCSCSFGTGREASEASTMGNAKLTEENTLDESNSSMKPSKLDSKYQDDMVVLTEYASQYIEETSMIKGAEYQHLEMKNTVFIDFPNCKTVGEFVLSYPEISVDDSISVIKTWLEQNGLSVDLNQELYAVTSEVEWENDFYPHVMPHIHELSNGNGFFINTNQCHIQMGNANIYSMSNGKMTACVKSDGLAGQDAMGDLSENVVEEGYVKDLKNQSYELLNGQISIGDAADAVREYFKNGTPYPNADGIEVDVPYVTVFSLGEIYGYRFIVRRIYKGVPFAYGDFGAYRESNTEQRIALDIKVAYTITGDVDAYVGASYNSEYTPICEIQDSIISVSKATEILDEFVGNQMKLPIQRVAFEYCMIEEYATGVETIYPCWSFEGVNNVDGRIYVFYVNALTGAVMYHSYGENS